MKQSYRLSIRREDGQNASVYHIEGREEEKLLDLLIRIQREQDPTLGYRASCYTGKCGTCNIRINGDSKLSCQTMVTPGEYHIESSKTGKLIRDLITEWPFTR